MKCGQQVREADVRTVVALLVNEQISRNGDDEVFLRETQV